ELQALRGIAIVLDDEDPTALDGSPGSLRRRRRMPRRDAQRQAHDERAPLAATLAVGLDRAAVHLRELLREREAYSQARDLRLVFAAISPEHREELRHHLGGDADARIGQADLDLRVRRHDLDHDAAGLG